MRTSIVQVLHKEDHALVCGSGAILASNIVATCAHVVSFALSAAGTPRLGDVVTVAFPFIGTPEPHTGCLVGWLPGTGSKGGDIALLRLDELPSDASPASWGVLEGRTSVRALGFPSGHNGASSEWAYGWAGDPHPGGWIQLQDSEVTGYWIKPGFSGAPVWSASAPTALGLVTAVDTQANTRVAFMIPARIVADQAASANLGDDVNRLAQSFHSDRLPLLHEEKRERLGRDFPLVISGNSFRVMVDLLEAGEVCEHYAWASRGTSHSYMPGILAATDRRVLYVLKPPGVRARIFNYRYADLKRVDAVLNSVQIEVPGAKPLMLTNESDYQNLRRLIGYIGERMVAYREYAV